MQGVETRYFLETREKNQAIFSVLVNKLITTTFKIPKPPTDTCSRLNQLIQLMNFEDVKLFNLIEIQNKPAKALSSRASIPCLHGYTFSRHYFREENPTVYMQCAFDTSPPHLSLISQKEFHPEILQKFQY